MKPFRFIYIWAFAVLLAGCSSASVADTPEVKSGTWYPVSDTVDGDTFKIKIDDQDTTIRLLYIDTPETVKPNSDVEPYGPEASQFTKQLLDGSKEVRLTFDKGLRDQYNRTLALVELKDGRILNELLLQEGLAKLMIVEPNVKMENVYKGLEQKAKNDKLGLWSSGEETSQTDVPVKTAMSVGVSIEVDKIGEKVTLTNTTSDSIQLNGWKIVSVRGNQTFTFKSYNLQGGQQLVISSGDSAKLENDVPMFVWEAENVWNNNEPDPAELYNENNDLVALWEDK
ncbi:thermonuclease family protein [Paenibacillus sp. GCM10027627]|uniref:thermonuclease family protein n=1 Tax=unclassified Paenibacillus TaxID=185978 RepID=UPI0036252B06